MSYVRAPFTPDQVEALNRFQRSRRVHPFTCGQRDDHESEGVLVATPAGWVCPEPGCDYTQDWAHAFMAAATCLCPLPVVFDGSHLPDCPAAATAGEQDR